MYRIVNSIILIGVCFIGVAAQQAETRSRVVGEVATTANKDVRLQSGTHIEGRLQNSIDVRNAKVGDRVTLKTTEPILAEGRKVVKKGAKLLGHVTEVTQKSKSNSDSRICVLFDTMQDGAVSLPITATIVSITGKRNNGRPEENEFRTGADAQVLSSGSMSQSAGRAGLVGGVTNTVGSAISSSTATAGTVVGTTTAATDSVLTSSANVAGSSTSTGSLRHVQLSQASSTSVEGGSVLSLRGENLRLEKGTTFNLVISQSVTTKQQ